MKKRFKAMTLMAAACLWTSSATAGLSLYERGMTTDVDGDGQDEVVRIVRDDPGGSGIFYHLLVINTDDQGKLQFTTAFLGDRVQFLNLTREGQDIVIDMVQSGDGDAACCPTHKVLRRWSFQQGKLVEKPAKPYGQVNMGDLAGQKWRLQSLDGNTLPADTGITMTYGNGKLSGRSGCNGYQVGVQEPAPGKLEIHMPMAATQVACPAEQMDREALFLQRLEKVKEYQWMGNYLVLGWQDGKAQGSLVFVKDDE